jgi:uncharacterized protein YbjT (DUF2867 family)
VVVAGARGFVGEALLPRLLSRFHVVALGRSVPRTTPENVEWRRADLYSLKDAESGVAGATVGVYLVHSMLPGSRLTQGSFRDLDLITADNFARAAKKAGVRQIVYVGGLAPEGSELSPHLASRLEVERALGAHGIPVTAIRAGLLVGARGSSFVMLRRLVERLPMMGLPPWMDTETHPVALDDVVAALEYAVGNEETFGRTFDVGGPESMSYRQMVEIVARVLGKRPLLYRVPFIPPAMSALWVRLVTGAPKALVAPLVESLPHRMVARDSELFDRAGIRPKPFDVAVREALSVPERRGEAPAAYQRRSGDGTLRTVRSVQRLPLPRGKSSDWTAQEYMRWLPKAMLPLLHVSVDASRVCRFFPIGLRTPLLVLEYAKDRSAEDRALFYIRGGLLARVVGRGRLEFRSFFGGAFQLAAVHDYVPRLPWPIYACTQAVGHLWIMRRFGKHLKRLDGGR